MSEEIRHTFSIITLAQLQSENKEWADKNFPSRLPYYPLLGAVEELGELAHAHLKTLQGIRGTAAQHQADKEDAIGDILVYLADYCSQNGIDMELALSRTWDKVKRRDWNKDKMHGGENRKEIYAEMVPEEVANWIVEHTELIRLSGIAICSICGIDFNHHPEIFPTFVLMCNGKVGKT